MCDQKELNLLARCVHDHLDYSTIDNTQAMAFVQQRRTSHCLNKRDIESMLPIYISALVMGACVYLEVDGQLLVALGILMLFLNGRQGN